MSDEEESQELVMIAEKARSLLNRNERQVLSHCCHSYLSGLTGVHKFVDALLRLLPTPDKVTPILSFEFRIMEQGAARSFCKIKSIGDCRELELKSRDLSA